MAPVAAAPGARLPEADALWWREGTDEGTLRRDGWRWTAWTAWVALFFAVPGAVLLAVEPLAFPATLVCLAHAYAVPRLQAARGARAAVPLRPGGAEPERVALGLLGDLVGHAAREVLADAGLVVERGRLGIWVLGARGALLVRPGGRRVFCWCVRTAEEEDLPAADRVVHLLLALRADEEGFATVCNLQFAGAVWRVRRRVPKTARGAFDAAVAISRAG